MKAVRIILFLLFFSMVTMPAGSFAEKKNVNEKSGGSNWYPVVEKRVAYVPVLLRYEQTEGMIYARFYFDMRTLPFDLIQYGALLTKLAGNMSTEHYSFTGLNKALTDNTEGSKIYLTSYLKDNKDINLIPKFVISADMKHDKIDTVFSLVGEIVTKTNYSDKSRIKELLKDEKKRLEADISKEGDCYAAVRLSSYFGKQGTFNDLTQGVRYYRFVSNLLTNFDSNYDVIRQNIINTAALLFNKSNIIVSAALETTSLSVYLKNVEILANTFPHSFPRMNTNYFPWDFVLEKKNEGFILQSKKNHLAVGYNFKKLGYVWDGSVLVLNEILSSQFNKQDKGFAVSFSPSGQVCFVSRVDSDLQKNIEYYNSIPEFVGKFNTSPNSMKKHINAVVTRMNKKLTPREKGDAAVKYYFEGITRDDVEKLHNEITAVTAKDIRILKPLVEEILAQKALCAIGNDTQINSGKEILKKIEVLNP